MQSHQQHQQQGLLLQQHLQVIHIRHTGHTHTYTQERFQVIDTRSYTSDTYTHIQTHVAIRQTHTHTYIHTKAPRGD